jgi:Arc/MetJ-type ribon-helix-helix transcriptional regulator
MSITLDPRIEAYLLARVASGDFASINVAANDLLGELADSDGTHGNIDVSALREMLRGATEEADRGEFVDFDAESVIQQSNKIRARH